MADTAGSAEPKVVDGPSPVPVILFLVLGTVIVFCVVNVALWYYATKNAPPRPKKKLGVKKAKREKLKMGISAPGE